MPSSLSGDTKDALAREIPEAAHCREALLHALMLYGIDRKGRFATRRHAIARLFRSLQLVKPPASPAPGNSDASTPKPAHRCDRIMEIRAAFLTCGSLSGAANGYHLEFSPSTEALAERLAFMLRSLGREPKHLWRRSRTVLYFKDFDAIAEILTEIGAFNAVLQLEDTRALRETKNRIHRLVNTEAANLERSAEAGAAQQRMIRFLIDAYGIGHLTPALREIAELRLAFPEESLHDLGRRCNPPVGKPTVNSRLNALARLAKRLHYGQAPAAAG